MDRCTLSLCVVSAELDSAANGAYCKIYVDSNDMTHGSSGGHDAPSPDSFSQASTARDSAMSHGPRAFHTHVEKSDKKTYLPTWNETFTIDVYDPRNEILTIRLKSKKLLHVSVVGACAIPLRQISTARPVDQWFPILKGGKRRGKLRLQMMITLEAPQAYAGGAGTPQQSLHRAPPPPMPQTPPQPATLLNNRHSGSRRSSGSSSFSSQQRRSSLNAPNAPSPNPYQQQHQQQPPPYQQQPPQYQQSQQQVTLATAAAFGEHQPEAEPPKEQSPQRKDTVDHMYRPPTNPRMDLESDDDDETSFPRVAELHRMESDLIGESSDEEIDEKGLMPLSPLYMERLTEGGASHEDDERAASPGSPRSSGSFARRSEQDQRFSVASASSNQRLSVQQSKPRPSVDATSSESSATSTDRRVSVEIARQTRVAVDHDEFAETVLFDTDDMIDGHLGLSVESGGEPSSPQVATGVPVDEVWSRYPSSSSSEELEAAYPDSSIDEMVDRSSSSSIGVDEEEEVLAHAEETNQFVEPASPTNSSQHDEYEEQTQQHGDFETMPRGSISSDDEERDEYFGVERGSASIAAPQRKLSSPRTSWISEEGSAVAPVRKASSPRTSWISEDTSVANSRKMSSPRTSWVSEDAQTPNAASPRELASPRTSWVSESTSFVSATVPRKDSSPRSSWVNENASEYEQHTNDERSGHSWVSDNSTSLAYGATPAERKESLPRSSWISEQPSEQEHEHKSEYERGSWVSESDRGSVAPDAASRHEQSPRSSWVSEPADEMKPASMRGSWVSESDRGSLPGGPGAADKDPSTRGSWVSESDRGSIPGSPGARNDSSDRGSWVSESEGGSFVGEHPSHAVLSPRNSWVSETTSSVAANVRRESLSSWISESDTASVIAGAPRRPSHQTSWISEHDDESAPSPSRDRVLSSRTSWVSESDTESVVAGGARRQYSLRSSWISEHDDESAAPSPGARGRFASGTSWISEGDNTSFVDASAASPSNSWISEEIGGDASRTSWISEDQDTPPRGKASSWISEDAEADRRRQRTRTSSFRTSWISETSPQTSSFVDASFLRHSFVSEGSVGNEEREQVEEDVTIMPMRDSMDEPIPISPREDIAILASPVGGTMVGATTPTRLSLVIESGDADSETDTPRASFAVEEVAEGLVVEEVFAAERISLSSEGSVEKHEEQHALETTTTVHDSITNDERAMEVDIDQERYEAATTPRDSFSSEQEIEVATHRQSSSSARLATEVTIDDVASCDSVVSAERGNGSSSSEDFEDSYTPRESLSSDVAALDEGKAARSDVSASSTPRNSLDIDIDARFDAATTPRGSSSSYDANDDLSYSTTPPLESLSGSHLGEAGRFEAATTPRSSMSSERDQRDDGYSSYAESFGESVTRDSSVSSFSADNYVDRDDPDQHAEAVADAARYSSSSEDEFENHDARAKSASTVDGKATPPRRYSSASEDDTVDRSSLAVVETFDNSHAIPRYSSSSQDTEAQSTTWGEESSTNEELMDALRRVSQVSGVSDMYDLSPRSSEDTTSQSRPSSYLVGGVAGQQFGSGDSQQVPDDLRRFISTVNVLVEPYDEDSPRSSISNDDVTASNTDAYTYNEDEEEEELVESVDLDELVGNVEHVEMVSPANMFVEIHHDSPRSSVSIEEVLATSDATEVIDVAVDSTAVGAASERSSESSDAAIAENETLEPHVGISVRPTVAMVKDVAFVDTTTVDAEAAVAEEVAVVVETLTEISPLAVAVEESLVESSPLADVAVEEVVALSSPHMTLDNIIATRDFVEDSELSPHSSLSSLSPRDSAYDNLVAGESSGRASRHSSSSRRRSSTGGRRSRKSSQNVSFSATPSTEVATSSTLSTAKDQASSSPSLSTETTLSSAVDVSVNAGNDASADRQNVRGDHVLVSAKSTLTTAQLSTVALDYLPSSDSESDEEDAFSSDADFNFDSD